MAICIPAEQTLSVFSLTSREGKLKAAPLSQMSSISAISMRATRDSIWDLLVVKPDHSLTILSHGLREIPLEIQRESSTNTFDDTVMEVDADLSGDIFSIPIILHKAVISVQDAVFSSCTLVFDDGSKSRTTIDLVPQDALTCQSLQVLALTLPPEHSFALHAAFLKLWSLHGLTTSDCGQFEYFSTALCQVFDLDDRMCEDLAGQGTWSRLSRSQSCCRFSDDQVFNSLRLPPQSFPPSPSHHNRRPHHNLAPVLYALHTLAEGLRLTVDRYDALLKLAPLICRIAIIIRPEWADYWKRLCPDAMTSWPSPTTTRM
jgi:anaphase-promoting complex subunit 1